jgi:citrate lyase subunit beta/citryl-CoA lyase
MAKKSGVISLGGKMIDAPMIIRAERVLAYAGAVDSDSGEGSK